MNMNLTGPVSSAPGQALLATGMTRRGDPEARVLAVLVGQKIVFSGEFPSPLFQGIEIGFWVEGPINIIYAAGAAGRTLEATFT